MLSVCMDGFSRMFEQQSEFQEFLIEREKSSTWERVAAKQIRFLPLYEVPLFDIEADAEVVADTESNTNLVMLFDGRYYCLRDCSTKSILARARIGGNALKALTSEKLTTVLNYCMEVARGKALIRVADQKVAACHGGDESDYAILPMPDVFSLTADYLNESFPKAVFKNAFYEHPLVGATWELEDAGGELLSAHQKTLKHHGIQSDQLTAALQVSSSDTGSSCATLTPSLIAATGRRIVLGGQIKTRHENGATLADFHDSLKGVFALYKKSLEGLGRLLEQPIEYPENTMLGVMKSIKLGKKKAYLALDRYKATHVGAVGVTAYDLYLAICEVLFFEQAEQASGVQMALTEEKVARAIQIRWDKFDMPGEFKW